MRIGLQVPSFTWAGGPAELGAKLVEIGIQHAIFNLPNVAVIEPLEVFGKEIIPAVSAL